jgi:TolB-like protein/DNA-binding winged helix-turn-helix (wHTH) protein/Tfp pilus assembly protein PilF
VPSGNLGEVVQIGEWIVEPALDTISRGAETHKLEPRTMQLLMCLANSAGAVVSVEQLLNDVWAGVVVGSASVYQAVSQLRKLLGDVDPNPTYIVTVPRKGYRLIARVRPVQRENVAPGNEPAPARRSRNFKSMALVSVALAAIALTSVATWENWPVSGRATQTLASIVVLPFLDLTVGNTDQSFCDGLTEELSSWLAQIPTLRVVARTSAFAFRGQGEDVRKIGKALDTDHILEGSIRRDGDHMRITVQLIDARNGYHLWSESFDRPTDDAIKIQEDISRSVAEILQVRLTAESERQFAVRRNADPQAYQLFLLARYYDQQATPQAIDRAVDLYRQVVNTDPKFALAYPGLARALLNQGYFRDVPIAETAAAMEPLIASALRIDADLSGAYAIRGALRASQSREKEALEDLHRAIFLDPNAMSAYASIGRIHLIDGRPREALKNYDSAAALDPLNSTLQTQRCVALGDLGQVDEAVKACERARVLQPGTAAPADDLTWIAESRGRIDEALRWNALALKAEPNDEFDLYSTRATLFLTLGLAAPARAAVALGRAATKDAAGSDAALVRVVYCEGGAAALRAYLQSAQLEQSSHAGALIAAAYARMLLADGLAAKRLTARALSAPDWPLLAETWYARGDGVAISYRLDLAVAEIQLGDRQAAERELNTVLAMVNRMLGAGVERYATYELRARVYALTGQGDAAMRDLDAAAKIGWRRAWWAAHEPYFASLNARNDYQALIAAVGRSNADLIAKLQADPATAKGP